MNKKKTFLKRNMRKKKEDKLTVKLTRIKP